MAPKADATDGKLSICSVHRVQVAHILCLPFLVAAKHTGIRGFDIDDCGTCEVRLKDPMVLHADGEYCGDVTKLQFRCLPGMLLLLKKRSVQIPGCLRVMIFYFQRIITDPSHTFIKYGRGILMDISSKKEFDLYKDIQNRTDGEVYLGL